MVGTPHPPMEHFLRLTTCTHREGLAARAIVTVLTARPPLSLCHLHLLGEMTSYTLQTDWKVPPLFPGARHHSQCLSPLLHTPVSLCVNKLELD